MYNSNTNNTLTQDQRHVLDNYISQYNSTTQQIDRLQDRLETINHNMFLLTQNLHNNNPNNRNHETQQPSNYLSPRRNNVYNYSRLPRTGRNRENNNSNLLNETFYTFLNTFVPVRASEQQIRNSTRLILFSEIENPINTTCPITLTNFQNNELVTQICGCGHIFNTESLNTWFNEHVQCPTCRYDIRNYNLTQNQRENNNETSLPTDISENETPRINTQQHASLETNPPSSFERLTETIFDSLFPLHNSQNNNTNLPSIRMHVVIDPSFNIIQEMI
jgi:hypothetical protein